MENTPTVIGNCRIIKKLGQGGMGAVYKAEHTTLGREVALKLLPLEFAQSKESIERFLREARAAAQLKHPNIVPVFDAGTQGGQYYITMELVDGASLGGLLTSKGTLNEQDALNYMLQSARGLEAAHAAGLIHRDIKPDNLLINKEGEVKIADFGLVSDNTKSNGLTQSGAMLGTPSYMSPEQCNGQRADERSDLYSLGATFYRLITGQAPYQAPTPIAVLYKHLHEPTPDPRATNPNVSEWFANLLQRLMAKRPEARIQNASELISLLESPGACAEPTLLASDTPLPIHAEVTPSALNAIAGQSTVLTPGATPSFMQAPAQESSIVQPRSKWWRLTIAAALLLMATGGGYFGFQEYHELKVNEAKRSAFDLASLGKHSEAILTLEHAFETYPEHSELKRLRDSYEAASVAGKIEELKKEAHTQRELKHYPIAIERYDAAMALQKQHAHLEDLKADATLVELKENTVDLRDYYQFMATGRQAEETHRYPAALEAYKTATLLEGKLGSVGTLAKESITRTTFSQLMAKAKDSEEQAEYQTALNHITRAAELNIRNVSGHQHRIENRIQFEQLLSKANQLSDKGEFQNSANTLKQAVVLAPDASTAERLQKRVLEMTTEANFITALSQGNKALAKNNWAQALIEFKNAQRIKPKEVLTQRKIRQAQAIQYLELGSKSFKDSDWKTAGLHWQKALTLVPRQPVILERLNALKRKRTTIQTLDQTYKKHRLDKSWQQALNQLDILIKVNPPKADQYKRLADTVRFDWGMEEAQALRESGQLEAAVARAQKAMAFDPTGGAQAQVLITEIQTQLKTIKQAADTKDAQSNAFDLVKSGKVKTALIVLANASQAAPQNAALRNSWIALQAVDAIEGGYQRLSELQQDAQASAKVSSDQKKKKDIKAWLSEIQEWKTHMDGQSGAARAAWLERNFKAISPNVETMKKSAREMAQSFTSLAANFRGKAVSTAKPKARIGGFSFGGRRGRGGGFGGSGNIGGDTKRAAIYDSTAATLNRCAAEARRIGAAR